MQQSEISLLTVRDVCARCGLSRPTLYRRIAAGQFPGAVYIGSRSPRWRSDVIDAWMEQLPSTPPPMAA